MFPVHSVDYILTTANHWKKPIKEFHLIVESNSPGYNVKASTCFEKNNLKVINDKRYEAIIKDFIPKDEVKAFFLYYPIAE